jgi:2-oxoglutarate dehydrogenase complex dehydrogenase (E1) component-like enzyme
MGPQMQEVADALRLDTELSADSAAYIEELYEQYLTAPDSVEALKENDYVIGFKKLNLKNINRFWL